MYYVRSAGKLIRLKPDTIIAQKMSRGALPAGFRFAAAAATVFLRLANCLDVIGAP